MPTHFGAAGGNGIGVLVGDLFLMVQQRKTSLARQIALCYLRHPGATFTEINLFQRWIHEQFVRLPIRVEWVRYDPYPDAESMQIDVASTGILKVTTQHNEFIFDPKVNLYFRAVHDYDHCRYGLDFGFDGERQVAQVSMNRCRSLLGRQLIFSEVVAQAAVALETGRFPKQKFVPFPESLIDEVILRS